MILNNTILQKYKDYLILLDYPFIKQQNDNEIKKIFEKENRILLLSWLITKYIPSCNSKIEEAQKDNKIETYLTNIIYENGFCRSSEKDLFVKGTLDDNNQIVIFNRIFSMLSLLYSNNSTQENMTEDDLKLKQIFMKPSEELRTKIIPEINLFPTIGLPIKMTNAEREAMINSYKTELDNLKNILEIEEMEMEANPSASEFSTSSNCTTEDIENLVAKLKKNVTAFCNDDFVSFTNNKTGIVTSSNKTELENIVTDNSKEINSLIQTLQKKKELNNYIRDENISENDDSISFEDDFSASIRHNYVMSNNIIEESNRHHEA